jgi:radical SAM protein with 4Fe4S-binding SPASM domain
LYTIEEQLATPCQIDMEITTACNHSCRYCYNFWRHDESSKMVVMSKETIDRIIDEIIKNKVFNVVLTGGEPFTNYEVLLHGVKRLTDAGILVSCNSNLTMATPEQLRCLKQAGLPHILTSLSSYDPEINDLIFNRKGSFQKIVKSIINAVQAGIKISINTVVSHHNIGHIYKTGILVHSLGAKNLFLTRVVPSAACPSDVAAEFTCTPEEYIPVLDDAIKVKKETGINVGSLIQYPVCFLKDVDKYVDFVGRGCSAGKKMVCINADGNTHACFHENNSYGNVLELGLKKVWDNLSMWRDNKLVPSGCRRCKWLRWCEGGCRISADSLDGPDYMCKGPDGLPDPVEDYQKSLHLVNGGQFKVRPGLRSREEAGFWLVHIVGAWITRVSPPVAGFIIERTKNQQPFTLQEFPSSREDLADLITKNIVETIA